MKMEDQKKRHKIFDVMVRGCLCPVYSIEGKEHNFGKWNGCPANWWVDVGAEVVEGTGVREERLEEYHDKGFHRLSWDIRFKEHNSYKYKWDEVRWNSTVVCEMYSNGKMVYSFHVRDIEFAMAKAQVLMVQLCEHPFNFFDQEKERGRKIWWYNLPATIVPGYDPGNIRVKPDYCTMDKETWWKEYHNRSVRSGDEDEFEDWEDRVGDYMTNDEINWGDALSDGHINWFRK